MAKSVQNLQRLGRALMLPIAVLPVAGLLLRLGQPDLLGIPVLAAAGDAVFSNLGLIFAVGVAVGLARENHGAAGLASLVGYLVATHGAQVLLQVPPDVGRGLSEEAAGLATAAWRAQQMSKLSMPVGVLSGLIAGFAYNRFGEIKLPNYLAFFGGRRFVPIATGCFGVLVATAFGLGWPMLARGMDVLSHAILNAGPLGLFAYGVLNRLLIVTGLHHILNNLAWFLLGDFHGVTGDLKRFFAGDPSAGAFMSGFFPVMMFGLPGACLAMLHAARPERRKAVAGLFLSIGLTSFLTGVTEPIEFTFMFLAPLLYAVHAVLTGVSMVIMHLLGVRLGFSFSAGLFDYVLGFRLASRPLWLLPVGAAYFAIYYGVFRFCIVRFNLATPGRETGDAAAPESPTPVGERAQRFVQALGGADNLTSVDACTTRLRLSVRDATRADRQALAQLGAQGVIQPAGNALQVVLGPIADQVAGEIRRHLRGAGVARESSLPESTPASPQVNTVNSSNPALASLPQLLAGLGGTANIIRIDATAGRLLVQLRDPAGVDQNRLIEAGIRDAALSSQGVLHVLLHEDAVASCAQMQALLRR